MYTLPILKVIVSLIINWKLGVSNQDGSYHRATTHIITVNGDEIAFLDNNRDDESGVPQMISFENFSKVKVLSSQENEFVYRMLKSEIGEEYLKKRDEEVPTNKTKVQNESSIAKQLEKARKKK